MTAYLQSILYAIVYLSRGLHTCTAVMHSPLHQAGFLASNVRLLVIADEFLLLFVWKFYKISMTCITHHQTYRWKAMFDCWGCLCVCSAWSIQWCGNICKWRSLPSIRNWQSYESCCRSGEIGFHSV